MNTSGSNLKITIVVERDRLVIINRNGDVQYLWPIPGCAEDLYHYLLGKIYDLVIKFIKYFREYCIKKKKEGEKIE